MRVLKTLNGFLCVSMLQLQPKLECCLKIPSPLSAQKLSPGGSGVQRDRYVALLLR
jgi:hypothetical protein